MKGQGETIDTSVTRPPQQDAEDTRTMIARSAPGAKRSLVVSASFIMLGNLASSLMGLVR